MPTILERLAQDLHAQGNPWLDLSFFGKNASRTPTVAGLRTAIAGTLWMMVVVILLTVPTGIGAAIYLEEYAPANGFSRFLEVNIRNLAGVPSIVYGILGLYVFVRLANIGTDYFPSEDDNVLVQGVQGNNNAMGFFGFAYYNENPDSLTALEVDGGDGCVAPSAETVEDASYTPLSRPLLIYISVEAANSNPTQRSSR